MKKLVATGVFLATVALAAPAWAHVTVQPTEAPVGSFFRFVVRVPNERDDANTTKVELQFPENLAFVGFQDKEGWDRTVQMKTLEEPIEVFGEEINEVVGSVTWTGGKIEPHEFEEFGFSARVPETEEILEFPAIQTYDSGEIVRWIGPPESEEPAALVSVVDVGIEEGQGPLAATAELQERVARLEQAGGTKSEGDASSLGLILGGTGTALGAMALIVALTRRRPG